MDAWARSTVRHAAPLDELAREAPRRDVAPECALGVARWRELAAPECWLGGDTARVFDLASVTKSFTAVALARAGILPHTPLRALLPELAASASADTPIELLLCHRAGLQAHAPLFLPLVFGAAEVDAAQALWLAANARRQECVGPAPPEGFAPVYSDLGYVLAGRALGRSQACADVADAVRRWVSEPLGLGDRLGSARQLGAGAAYVPTEVVAWRTPHTPERPLRGVVHDENAFALSGLGASGHAGLFGDVEACLRFGLAVLGMMRGQGPLRLPAPPRWLWRERAGGTWRAGFDGKSERHSSAGQLASPSSVGHLGFTGTSLWIDPERCAVSCVLSNRVNPSRSREPAASGVRALRPWLHDALWRFVDAQV